MAFLVAFADSSINLEVGFWIDDPKNGTLGLRSDVNRAILRKFREAGVEIPFPQREVTVKAGDATGPHSLAEPMLRPAASAPARVAPGAAAGAKHDSALDGPDPGG